MHYWYKIATQNFREMEKEISLRKSWILAQREAKNTILFQMSSNDWYVCLKHFAFFLNKMSIIQQKQAMPKHVLIHTPSKTTSSP